MWDQATRTPEGWRQWSAGGSGTAKRSVAGLAWWTDHVGRKHYRILSHRRGTDALLWDAARRPALTLLYPEHTFFRTRGGQRRLHVLCGCGVFGAPEEIAWMGDCCGPCYDRRQEGISSPVRPMQRWTLSEHAQMVYGLAFSPDSRLLASACEGGTVHLWDATTGADRGVLGENDPYAMMGVDFSPDGCTLAAINEFSGVRLWDVDTGRQRKRIPVRGGSSGLQFAPDGATLAWCTYGRTTLWDTRSEKIVARFGNDGFDLAFLRQGRVLVVGCGTEAVRMYDVPSRKQRAILTPQWDMVYSLAPTPDDAGIALGIERGRSHRVLFWDGKSEQIRKLETGHKGPIQSVAFSPDGRTMLTGSRDATIKAWDTQTGTERLTLEGHASMVFAVVFSPDGRLVASSSCAGDVRLWPAEVFG